MFTEQPIHTSHTFGGEEWDSKALAPLLPDVSADGHTHTHTTHNTHTHHTHTQHTHTHTQHTTHTHTTHNTHTNNTQHTHTTHTQTHTHKTHNTQHTHKHTHTLCIGTQAFQSSKAPISRTDVANA
jgi:hypothetical protein